MSGRNDEAAGFAMAFAVLGAGVLFLGAIVFAALILIAGFLTVFSLGVCILNRPVKVLSETVTPRDARIFLTGGISGAWMLPVFVWFCGLLYGIRIEDYVIQWLAVGGYIAGSFGLEIMVSNYERNTAAEIAARQPVAPPPPPKTIEARPVHKPEPFRFASWDDEEAGK